MKKYTLYWIRYPSHSDPYSEGYIGRTCNPKHRFSTHTNKSSALREHFDNGAEIQILYDGLSKKEVNDLEREYRPEPYIGWNVYPGAGSGRKATSRWTTNNGKTKNRFLNIRIKEDLYQEIREYAEKNDISISSLLRECTLDHIRSRVDSS